jgi:hypothetical protein
MSRHANQFDSTYRPVARTEDLVTTTSKDEVLVYDQRAHHIHHLNTQAAAVWHHCDGINTVDALSVATGMDADRVLISLKTLEDCNLVVEGLSEDTRRQAESRRRFLRKMGIATIPAIVSISAPIARVAASGGRPECQTPENYSEGHCWADCGCPPGKECPTGNYSAGIVGLCF